ncbi:multidrug effflux MFS transporter [Microbacterium sp.]|uniref:multidrug effflux MFS transporter n=1 Tax=Microbacterium sp. TaxID=51671 RepID=UPI0039E4876E
MRVRPPSGRGGAGVGMALIATLAVQSAVPPFATDTYTPAFPHVTADLDTTASAVGLTLTLFFLGFGGGQLIGGPLSDQYGRRMPMIIGGVVCTLGAIGCALAPSIEVLVAMRLVQGIGGGVAAAVARAVVIDVAHGEQLARVMSLLMALGGLAPAIAPVIGGLVLTFDGTWRVIFWALVVFGIVMSVTAAMVVPESLPPERRHSGGLGVVVHGFRAVLREPSFVGYVLTATASLFAMLAYIANSSYVLQEMKGMAPLPFSLFFATTALCQVGVTVVNARLIGRFRPQQLIAAGLGLSVAAVALIALTVLLWDTALVPVCTGFLVLMASQGLVFGNAAALAAAEVRDHAGSASGIQGIAQSLGIAVSAPLATSGGGRTAVPMVLVMVVGISGALVSFALARRAHRSDVAASA